MSESSQL